MEADIQKQLGFDVEKIEGGGGVFDVHADGKLIFSKHEHDRFPEHAEILDALNQLAVDQ